MTISSLALAAKKIIDAAWLHGDAYDLSSQAAFALESAQLLQSPESAAELEQARLRVDEVERAYMFDTAALKRRIAELETERHSTNESLDEAVQALRADRARIAELEQMLVDAPLAVTLTERAAESADRLTRFFAPTQALREDSHDGPLRHSYLISRDLPETGGVS